MPSKEYKVTGMTCEHCASAVKDEITAIDGVTGVEVDVATGLVQVSGSDFTEEAIREAVEEAGYTVVK
ncbi:MAG: heavy-metal-associated domain-containing protein [Corynebacterium sp.]|nr:heavy-metal-associated domain-containing protein [Corynebacterium sp.]